MPLSPMPDDTTHSQQSGPDVPDYCEPILAWRYWRVMPGDDLLQSYRDSTWTPYEPFKAEHVKGAGTSRMILSDTPPPACKSVPCSYHKPGIVYGCGVYGFKERRHFQLKMEQELNDCYNSWLDHTGMIRLFGSVWLWGRIWEHELGYRAQYAYPASFIYGYNCDAAKLASIYGIPYKEDLSWKSVFPSVDSSRNHYVYPSQNALLQSLPPRSNSLALPSLLFPASQPQSPSSSRRNWPSQYLHYSPKMRMWYDAINHRLITDAEMEAHGPKHYLPKPLPVSWHDPSDDTPPKD